MPAMSFLDLFHWLAHTSFSIALRESTWAFAITEVIHLLALSVFGGTVLLINLRFWGTGLKLESIDKVVRSLSSPMLGSLVMMVITGILMVVSGPMRYYYNAAFRWKMVLFLIGALVQFALYRRALKTDFDTSKRQRFTAGLSLTIWFAVALAGRAIGYV
jgi:hypothetical protein